MDNATVITLAPPTLGQEVATFEEAFGEYSEARGRGRKRRAARKAKRRSKKTARKAARVSERDKRKRTKTETRRKRKTDRRSARVADRMARRKQRKTGRMSARQDKRNLRAKSRMDRRRMKAEERVARKAMRGDDENYEEDYYPEDEGYDYDDTPYEEDGYGEDGFEAGYDDSGYEDDYGYDDDDDYDDEGDYDDYADDDYDEGYGEEYDDGGYEDDYSDDEWADEPYDDYEDDDWGYFDATSGVDGQMSPNPRIQKITDKIEWNKEWVSRARVKLDAMKGRGQSGAKLKQAINEKLDRISWLEDKLAAFMDNSDNEEKKQSRRMNIGLAKRNSINSRKTLRSRGRGRNVTPVEADLDPEISRDEIVIPPADTASNADASRTGLTALDNQDDYDSPNARVVELTSNADGEGGKKFPIKPVLIGVGAAAVIIGAIVLLKKRKK